MLLIFKTLKNAAFGDKERKAATFVIALSLIAISSLFLARSHFVRESEENAIRHVEFIKTVAQNASSLSPNDFRTFEKWSMSAMTAYDQELDFAEKTYLEAAKETKPDRRQCCSDYDMNRFEENDSDAEKTTVDSVKDAIGFAKRARTPRFVAKISDFDSAQTLSVLYRDYYEGKPYEPEAIRKRLNYFLNIPTNYQGFMLQKGFVKEMRELDESVAKSLFVGRQ